MVARGYRGQATAIDRRRLGAVDLVVFGAVVFVTLLSIGIDHVVVH
jgi:energy-coupling factor transporter transmembrane protein EcfT